MDRPVAPSPMAAAAGSWRDRTNGIVTTAAVLALLYFGRDVLVPIILAALLSLLIAPLVLRLRRWRFGPTSSVLAAVLTLTLGLGATAAVIGVQVARTASSLPRYEHTIKAKLDTLNDLTIGRIGVLAGLAETSTRASRLDVAAPFSPAEGATAETPIPVVLRDPPANPWKVIEKWLGSLWVPIETAGIVLVVLIFLLLEHEALRDRLIRIIGGNDIRATTLALNDAGERLSRFFVSQFAVNLGVGAAIAAGLAILSLPHALLWGAIAAVLRFVPYVGVWIAAMFATLLGAAVDPGWMLAFLTLGLFVIVELIAGQLVEPQLYGHTTGLSPLSVVIAAIFWSGLWGPIGLIVSTPLTLCLLVAGRHIKALGALDILLGDTQALTMPQRFYQRALSGDANEIIAGARAFLKENSFACYCDLVLIPGLHLARIDLQKGSISDDQLRKVRTTLVDVVSALGGKPRRASRRYRRMSVLDTASPGRELRKERETEMGRWQGPLSVPPGSIMLCVGLSTNADELAAELLVRVLREQKIDARHVSADELRAPPPPSAPTSASISMVYIVSAFPGNERHGGEAVAAVVRHRFADACIVSVNLPGMLLQPEPAEDKPKDVDREARSFGQAVQICLDWHREHQAA